MSDFDGHPDQAGIAHTVMTGNVNEQSLVGLVECLVIARRFRDEPGNRSRLYTEYDVRSLRDGQPITNCRRLLSLFGVDGEEYTLRPANGTISGKPLTQNTPARDTDGDRVVVAFLNGSRQNAVILGCLPNDQVSYAPNQSQGARVSVQFRGTRRIIDDTGWTLNRFDPNTEKVTSGLVLNLRDEIVGFGKAIKFGDFSTLRPCAGVGDSVAIDVTELYAKLKPYFVTTGPPPVTGTANGSITSGSSIVQVSK